MSLKIDFTGKNNMEVQERITIDELPILIISNDAECAYQMAKQADLGAGNILSVTPRDDVRHLLEHIQPQVIIAVDDGEFAPDLFQSIADDIGITTRPILISISDHPASNLFTAADHVIATSYLPYVGQIIAAHRVRIHKSTSQDKQWSALEADNERLTQELAVANQTSAEISLLKQAIVHGVSHELRTPMLQVKSAVALLSEDEHTNRTIVELAMEATIRLEGGIRNITLLNELMNENSNPQAFSPTPVVQIIQTAIRNLGRSWQHKKEIGRVEIISTNNLRTVLCDKQRMTMAIQLLLDNALKFSQDGVKVEITEQGDKVTLSIADQGIGIAPDQIAPIFEPFYQIDGTSTRKYGGMGIGLAIVRLILDQHCTAIRLDSNVGKGSTFAFDLAIPENE